MTALKDLLDEAAGHETGLSEAEQTAFLSRGHRALRRRRVVVSAGVAAATAAVVGLAWAVVPGVPQAESGVLGPTPGVTKPTKATPPPVNSRPKVLPVAPKPDRPVELVPDGVVRDGTNLVCDLKPKGWKVEVEVQRGAGPDQGALIFRHPTLDGTGQYYETTTYIAVHHEPMYDDGKGQLRMHKSDRTWAELAPHRKAGQRSAVVSASSMGPQNDANGLRTYWMRMTERDLIELSNDATPLGWSVPTALRFLGSCHYAR